MSRKLTLTSPPAHRVAQLARMLGLCIEGAASSNLQNGSVTERDFHLTGHEEYAVFDPTRDEGAGNEIWIAPARGTGKKKQQAIHLAVTQIGKRMPGVTVSQNGPVSCLEAGTPEALYEALESLNEQLQSDNLKSVVPAFYANLAKQMTASPPGTARIIKVARRDGPQR